MKILYRFFLYLAVTNILFGASQLQGDTVQETEEEVYLSFRYQGVIDAIVVAYYDNEDFYLPLTDLFDLFALNYELNTANLSVSGYYLKEDTKYILNFKKQFAQISDESYPLPANEYKVKEVDFYITPSVFKNIFGLNLSIDLSRLTLSLDTRDELPIIARHTRRYKEQLRQQYSSGSSIEPYELLSGRELRILDGGFLDYSLFSSVSEVNNSTSSTISMGAEVLYGDVQGTLSSNINQDTATFAGSDFRWRYINESQPWFSSVSVGQQSSTGLSNQIFQGLNVSNQPLVPQRSYDSYLIDGTTENEAEVELYQDNRLVEVVSADDTGYYRFLVPLNYGTSDFKIRIYGKQGRVIDLDRRVQIPFNFLPVGEFRYDLSTGKVGSLDLPWSDQNILSSLKLAYGATNWLTTGIGIEYLENNNHDQGVVFGKLSSRVAGDILLGFDAALKNFYRFSARGVGPNASTFSAEYTYYDPQSHYNTSGFTHDFTSNMFYPFSIFNMRFTGRGSFGVVHRSGENKFNFSADINQFIRSVRIYYGIQEVHSFISSDHSNTSRLKLGGVYTIPRLPSIHPLIRGSYFRADLSYVSSQGELEEIRFQYIKQLSKKLRGQLISAYDLRQKNSSIEIGLTWDLDYLRSASTLRMIRSIPAFTQTIRGSAGFDRRNGQLLWDNRQQVGRSGLSIRMYVDENSSNTYDEGEEIIPGNAITIENASSRQLTKAGISRLSQLQPYRRYNFHVNEARIDNPMLVAKKRKFSVITDPNRYKRIDIPFYTTGVIDGRVDRIKDGESKPLSGLRIYVRNEATGEEIRLRTFADGSFYSMEIPPGDYEMWVDDSQLEFLGMEATPARRTFTVISSPEGDFVEALDFIVE